MGGYKCWLDQPYLLVEQVRMVLAAYENLDFLLLFGIIEAEPNPQFNKFALPLTVDGGSSSSTLPKQKKLKATCLHLRLPLLAVSFPGWLHSRVE